MSKIRDDLRTAFYLLTITLFEFVKMKNLGIVIGRKEQMDGEIGGWFFTI